MKESAPKPPEIPQSEKLFSELTDLLAAYKNGVADLNELSRVLDALQKLTFEKLQREGKLKYEGDYQDYGESATHSNNGKETIYTKLGKTHPVITEQEDLVVEEEFAKWRSTLGAAYGDIQFPETGTISELFRIVLRHLIGRFRNNLSPEMITHIELQYILDHEIDEDNFIEAHRTILDGVIFK
jgi:hypothetical protein